MKGRAIGALVVAVMTALAGCGSGGSGDKNGQVTLTWWDYLGYSPDSNQAVQTLIGKYESTHPNVKIKRTPIGFADFHTKMVQAAATGKFPDIAAIDGADVPVFAGQNALADLTSKFDKWPGKQQLLKPVQQSVVYKNKEWGIPFRSNTTGLWYNKDLLSAAGIKNPPRTWDEMRADAKKLTSGKHAGICFAARAGDETPFIVLPFIWQAGGDVPTLGDPGSVQALNYINALVNTDKSAPRSVLQWGHSDVEDQFDSKLCAMMINGPWVLPSVKKAKFAYGVAPLPPGPQGKTATPLGGEVWVVGRNSKHTAQAWDAISYLAGPKVGAKELGALGAIPNRQDTINDPAWQWDPVVKVFAQQMPYARARSIYGGAKWPQVAEAIWTMTQEVLTGQKNAQAAANEAKSKVQPLLGG